MGVFFIGCLHLQHASLHRFRGWNITKDTEDNRQHDEFLIKQWNSVVNKKDLVWILGDVTMEKSKPYYLLDRLKGTKKVVLGNHDRWQDVPELLKYVDGVAGMVDYKGYCLTHSPVHVSDIGQYIGNIHAHIHHNNKLRSFDVNRSYNDVEDNPIISTSNKYINVDAHLLNYTPISFEQITKITMTMK